MPEEKKTAIEIIQWVKGRGVGMVRADCLAPEDPMHPYNQALSQGVRPEDFGIEHPRAARFKDYSRERLIEELVAAEKQIESMERGGMF